MSWADVKRWSPLWLVCWFMFFVRAASAQPIPEDCPICVCPPPPTCPTSDAVEASREAARKALEAIKAAEQSVEQKVEQVEQKIGKVEPVGPTP